MYPEGFRPFNPLGKVSIYRRHLPHWRQDGATYFVTFRLADSLPNERLAELKHLKSSWQERHPVPWNTEDWESYNREITRKVEQWLDAGHGNCWLKGEKVAGCLGETLRHFDTLHYDLFCYVIMPNHCHLAIRPLALHSLESILKSRKSMATRLINPLIESSGYLWQQESYDRIVRDREHLRRVLRYTGNRKAMIESFVIANI